MPDELVLNDSLAVRNRELTRTALATGEYGEAYLDLDTGLFAITSCPTSSTGRLRRD